MAFTFTQARQLKPEQVNPFANLISKSLQGYGQGVKSAYLPQMLEADIFSKKISPLATLATSPMFLQNPQFQSALGQLISKSLGFAGEGFQGGSNWPTYAGQVGKDITELENLANDLTQAGKIKTGVSSGAATTENYLGDIGKHIVDFFSGGKVNSDLAQKQHQFQTLLKTLKNKALQTNSITAQDAEDLFSQRKDETPTQAVNRIKKTNPALFQQLTTNNQTSINQTSKEEQNYQDNQLLNEAWDITEQIKQRIGKDIDPQIIFEYMQKNPGKIHIPTLLKKVG
jgi:hypothetical protein